MKLVIRSISVWGYPNIRTWKPENPHKFFEPVSLDIGLKSKKEADTFLIYVATPAGLSTLQEKSGVLAARPLLVMTEYDYDDLWNWLEKIVKKCEEDTWNTCVEHLRLYFNWEYDDYKEL